MDLNIFIYHIFRPLYRMQFSPSMALILILLFLIPTVTGMWKIFEKAGVRPYYALIPFYNYYQIFNIAWETKYSFIFIALDIAYMLLSFGKGQLLTMGFRGIFCVFLFMLSAFIISFARIKLAFSFKRGPAFAYGLIFLEPIFLLILGLNRSEYYGPTLRRYNMRYSEEKLTVPKGSSVPSQRRYMISLYKKRSVIALIMGCLVFFLSLRAIGSRLREEYLIVITDPGYNLFHYFTINSNLLSAIGAAFMIPYAIEGIRRKRFVFPKWVSMFQYSGAICTSLTMIFTIFLIAPYSGISDAFGGSYFWLHGICPILALILLFTVETDITFSLTDSLICLTPFYLYSLVYITNVVLLGEANGGWKDLYGINTLLPAAFTAPLMFMLGFGIAYLMRNIYNRLSEKRQKALIALWKDDASDVEINIEVYGLGRYNGKHMDMSHIVVPIDILKMLSEKYGLDLYKLCSIYNKGVIDGLKERNDPQEEFTDRLYYLIGTPQKLSQVDQRK